MAINNNQLKEKILDKEASFGDKLGGLNTLLPDLPPELGRFPLQYDLPGWSMHGGIQEGPSGVGGEDEGVSYTFDLFDNLLFLDGPVDVTGLFLVNMNLTGNVMDIVGFAVQKAIENYFKKLAEKFTTYVGHSIEDNVSYLKDELKKYHDGVFDAAGNLVTKGDNPTTIISAADLDTITAQGAKTLIDEKKLLEGVAVLLDSLITEVLNNQGVKDFLKDVGGDNFLANLNQGAKLVAAINKPGNSADEQAARAKAISDFSAFITGSSPNQVGNIHRQIPSGYRSSPPRWK